MLTELSIRNVALVQNLRLQFAGGLNVLTGETGAGKSIIIDSIGLLLGERASSTLVRTGAERAEVSGVFDLEGNTQAAKLLKELGLNEGGDDLLVIRREVDPQGRSRAYVNDRPVSLATLASLGDYLVDLHGQHEHQLLLKSGEQRELLDRYAGHEELRAEVARLHAEWKALTEERGRSQMSEQERQSKIDLYQYQLQEIESAKLAPGEEEETERALPQLKNSEKLQIQADELYGQLYDMEGSVMERLRKSLRIVQTAQALGVEMKEVFEQLEECVIRAGDAADRIDQFRRGLHSDPRKLDELISRQDLIAKLKRKYGATIPEILDFALKTKLELNKLEGHAQSLEEMDAKIAEAWSQLLKQARKLSASRRKSGEKLAAAVLKELKDLGFPAARLAVDLVPEKDGEGREAPTSFGLERIEFLFSANPGQDLKPLKAVASGGEISRIMLAVKKVLAESDIVPTLIFDEVDAGVGGTMGRVLGEKLKALSASHQVLLVTHLPQIAAFADRQVSVRKEISGKATEVFIEPVEKDKRVREIARMLGGLTETSGEPSAVSLRHANEMLKRSSSNN